MEAHYFVAPTSFSKLEKDINGITKKMLLEQLRELVEYGLAVKTSFEGYPLRVACALTPDKGAKILEALTIMQQLGEVYLMESDISLWQKGLLKKLTHKKWVMYKCHSLCYTCLIKLKEGLAMQLTSTAIENGIIGPKYGKHGTQFNQNGMPTYSLPFCITDAPSGAKSFALVLEDKDAYPVSGGFSWIHWTAANITKTTVLENESQTATDFVQGANSWISPQGGEQSRALSSFYGGMAPPDAPHVYELHVYALDCTLDLEPGFYMNQLYHKMDGHILESVTLKGKYID